MTVWHDRQAGVEFLRSCAENLMGTPNSHQTDRFDRLLSRYSSDFVSFCFHSGHGIFGLANGSAPYHGCPWS